MDINPVVRVANQKKPKELLWKIWKQLCAEATGDLKKALDAAAYDMVSVLIVLLTSFADETVGRTFSRHSQFAIRGRGYVLHVTIDDDILTGVPERSDCCAKRRRPRLYRRQTSVQGRIPICE